MAVAGLQNASPFASAMFGESQRASSLLKMWRELESQSEKPKLQRNGSDSDCLSTCTSVGNGSENGDDFSQHLNESENQSLNSSEADQDDDNHSTISGQSSDLGETERERVRQIFQEWMSNGSSKGHSSFKFRSKQWLGENECERVRVIRDWAQATAHQRNDCRDEVGSQIDQVRDGLATGHLKIGGRRPIRRLCGRQTLLDLLHKAQNERKRELLSLSEYRPVSEFAHRNRIQALLKGRFLRNDVLVLDKRPPSVAATELGLLRQRHTVSDLREGFLSKLDSSASTMVTCAETQSSFGDGNNGVPKSACRDREITGTHMASDMKSGANRTRGSQELEVQATETEKPTLVNEGNEQKSFTNFQCQSSRHEETMDINNSDDESVDLNDSGANRTRGSQELEVQATETEEPTLVNEGNEQELFKNFECQSSRHEEKMDINNGDDESVDINDSGTVEVYYESYETRSGASNVDEVNNRSTLLERDSNLGFDSHDASARVEESEVEDNVWREAEISWLERGFSYSLPGPSYNSVEEQDQIVQESHDWPSHDLQEVIDSWLDLPSGEAGTSVGRLDTYYFPDDDNVHDMELRELLSRRRVSCLLGSSFRESLDRVLQSHVERLIHVSDGDSELGDHTSFPEQNQQQLNGDQSFPLSERNPVWYEDDFQGEIWPHYNSNQQLEPEWDMINELRLDMVGLEERMKDMERMVEAYMDMQVELQRSVRQEVSAALNRSTLSQDTSQDNWLHDDSQWDHVRRGICCLCQDSKIDSLLYRCGHMCTCTICAENLVQYKGKCPMCRAPAVEAVRAYFSH